MFEQHNRDGESDDVSADVLMHYEIKQSPLATLGGAVAATAFAIGAGFLSAWSQTFWECLAWGAVAVFFGLCGFFLIVGFIIESRLYQRVVLLEEGIVVPESTYSNEHIFVDYSDIADVQLKIRHEGQVIRITHSRGELDISESHLPSREDLHRLLQVLTSKQFKQQDDRLEELGDAGTLRIAEFEEFAT